MAKIGNELTEQNIKKAGLANDEVFKAYAADHRRIHVMLEDQKENDVQPAEEAVQAERYLYGALNAILDYQLSKQA